MTHLTRWSLANRLIIGLATIAIVIFGLISTFSLKQELLPSITAPTAFVTATYPGATPQIGHATSSAAAMGSGSVIGSSTPQSRRQPR